MEIHKPLVGERATLSGIPLPQHEEKSVVSNAAVTLFPPPRSPLAKEASAIIEKSIEEYLTRTPKILVPGKSLANHIGDGEKKVFHLDEFKNKNVLEWKDITPMIEHDRKEIQRIAELAEKAFQAPCDQLDVMTILTERMKFFLRKSMVSSVLTQEVKRGEQAIQSRSESKITKILSRLPHGKRRAEQLKLDLQEKTEELHSHAVLHDGHYTVCPIRAWTSLHRGNPDCMWYHHSSLPPSTTRRDQRDTLRVNAFSIALAQLGVFQKGEGAWDQRYPSSPLEFWKSHVAPYV